MFWDVIDEARRSVLEKMVRNQPVKDCYLAGGTALALLLGHRESIDFDWFSPNHFSSAEIEKTLSEIGSLLVTESKSGTFHGLLDNIQVTWLRYPHPLLEPLISTPDVPGLLLASIPDIGSMKLIAASQRGARKDFIDLYAIEKSGIPISTLIQRLPEKFPDVKMNYYHIVKSLTYFDDAEREPMPRILTKTEWVNVKEFFISIQKRLLDIIP
ncbi:nucleotidyl transferase AbiEii/AbiGii toxin family protein [Effusibacillus lacus]|uniref:Nucleotidyl transferase AbiEii/AbiGii toxin family protein n=1 Tax=Effusibacillus lacus TaxID=1348429 RepID=A0A292YPJ1_9BACL|nr:nucleotidyl transferase AbiEii/AbiGii toxin family protein [Effusibacillus lacus]TCS74172.1 nucleotidyltransferase AbiEii toxin of type IV toxin-antitoxin system [Effusibacillus lacus]GAX90831.1 hypothetical protein EFBL_2473 [Effusibacillus lacus]